MSTVNPVSSLLTNSTTSSTSSTSSQPMGETEFLQLLVTQLQNQDPMNPVDNDQFVTQLATFSSLEQLISINQGVTELASGSGTTGTTSGTGSDSQSSTTSKI